MVNYGSRSSKLLIGVGKIIVGTDPRSMLAYKGANFGSSSPGLRYCHSGLVGDHGQAITTSEPVGYGAVRLGSETS